MSYTLDMSRRARIVELWATLKSLGKKGVSELVEDLHHKAIYFAKSLEENGFRIINDVCFNQVLTKVITVLANNEMYNMSNAQSRIFCTFLMPFVGSVI